MEIKTYQEKASRTLAAIENGTGILDELHMVLGMQTEVAEIADVYKKHIAYGKELDLTNIKEEIGDALWYFANLCNMRGWDMRDIMATNIAKLEARYEKGFTSEKAINRDLDKEREILEK